MVGHICRFNPRYAAAKQEIAAGKSEGLFPLRGISPLSLAPRCCRDWSIIGDWRYVPI
jgi:hypothetical protein